MKTYETRVKMLFRRLYAPGVNATQFKKLFKFKNRYRSTFRTIASLEHQFDTLVFRLYLLKNITLAQYCISNNFFLLNGESKLCWKSVVHPGNFIEVNSAKIWNIFYIHILSSMASLKKYYNRLFFKVCYPFVGKKKYRIFKEEKWKKKKSVRFLKKRLFHRNKVFYNRKQQKIFKKWFFFKPVVRRPLIMLRRERWFRQIKRLSKNGVFKWKKAVKYFRKLKKKKRQKRAPNYMLKHHLNKYNNFHYNKFYLKKDHFKNYKIQTKYSNSKVKSKKYIIQNIKTYIKKQPFLKIKKVLQKRCISILQRKKTSVLPKKVRLKKIVKQKKIHKSIKKSRVFKKVLTKKKTTELRFKKNKFKFKYKFKRPKWWKRRWVFFYWQYQRTGKKNFIFFEFRKKFNNSFKLFRKKKNYSLNKVLKTSKVYKVIPYIYKKKEHYITLKNQTKKSSINRDSKTLSLSQFFKSNFLNIYDITFKEFHKDILETNYLLIIFMFLNKHIKKFNGKPTQNLNIINKFINNIFYILNKSNLNIKNEISRNKRMFIKLFLLNVNFDILLNFKKILINKFNFLVFVKLNNFIKNLKKNQKKIESVSRIKRKYIFISGLFRKFQNYKIEFIFKKLKINKVRIEYKKINLAIKYRPFPIYYIETNYNTLSFLITHEFDFLHFPYKTALDFKSISHFFSK